MRVVLDPNLMPAVDVFPCEDSHAQKRSLFDFDVCELGRKDMAGKQSGFFLKCYGLHL